MAVFFLLLLLWPAHVLADMNATDMTEMHHGGHDMAVHHADTAASAPGSSEAMHPATSAGGHEVGHEETHADMHAGHSMELTATPAPPAMNHTMDNGGVAHMDHATMHGVMNATEHVHPGADNDPGVGVIEHLGEYIAGDATFRDESGRTVTMGEIVDKPTIIVPIYFSCPNVCAIIQSSLSLVLPEVSLAAGQDYQVVSVSFDDTDTPELAAHQKRNYMAAMDFKFPENGWRFLTGDMHNIRKLTDSLGFGFKKQGKDFLHPVVIMAVSPKGKIVRYLYGTKPLAFDLTMAATEAGKEQVGLSVKRVLAYCFSYDPAGKRYVFNFMKITGTGILIVLGGLLVGLLAAGRKKRDSK